MKNNECPDSHAANGVHWQASMILQQVKSRLIEMPEEIDKLKQTLSRRTDHSGIKERCAVILASLDGSSIKQISKRLSKSRQYVKRWLRRFITNGIDGLKDYPRIGRPMSLSAKTIDEVKEICFTSPDYIKSLKKFEYAKDSIHSGNIWTFRSLASVFKVSPATMCRFCGKNKISRSASGSYCFSTDRDYTSKITKVYQALCRGIDDENTIVLCFDEKPCIQANEHALVPTHEGSYKMGCRYTRHGTVHLLAAFNPKTGKVYRSFTQNKDRDEVKRFLECMVENNPELHDKKIKLILDNLSTHKLDSEWHQKHPEFEFIFTPTTSSWCNPVEAHFSIYSNAVLKGASWQSVDELVEASHRWYELYDINPIPFSIKFDLEKHLGSRMKTIENMKKEFDLIVERCSNGLRLNNSGYCYYYTIGLYLFRLKSERANCSKDVKEYKAELRRILRQ